MAEQQQVSSDQHTLFVYDDETEEYVDKIKEATFPVLLTCMPFEQFDSSPDNFLSKITHVVVVGSLAVIKKIIRLAVTHHFTVGIIPLKRQRTLRSSYGLSSDLDEAIQTAFSGSATPLDIITCNGEILLFKGTIGSLPLLDGSQSSSKFASAIAALKKTRRLQNKSFTFTTQSGRTIKTAACGLMILEQQHKTLATNIIEETNFSVDGMISMVVVAPLSIINYFKFISQALRGSFSLDKLTSSIGYIRIPGLLIDAQESFPVFIDGEEATTTPVECAVIKKAVRINLGEKLEEQIGSGDEPAEIFKIDNLPKGKEVIKAQKKHIPFFSYASEERFRDLFLALRADARIDATYITLMVLSSLLATVGLYLNSSSVVIGAMLLAPLMSPIVSLAMGLLRGEENLLFRSFRKILVGVFIALLCGALTSLVFHYKAFTTEMQARLNPSLLDLMVAIVAGIAGAYAKSYKEILQSLAGVGIAVALVPPLAVAGIGLGRMDLAFFWQAFLLFSTNIIGITLAAAYTFRVLGFSAAVQNKRGVAIIVCSLLLITIPLFFSYNQIVQKSELEKSWQTERFLVNGKYLIVREAKLTHHKDRRVLYVNLLARDLLDRKDLAEFKKKIQRNFGKKLIVRADIIYIP